MQWSRELKLKYLMGLNWTVTAEKDPDEGYTIIRVAELPSVIATGDPNNVDALDKDFWESLQASLESALEFGDSIQLPRGATAPWDRASMQTPLRNVVVKGNVSVQAFIPQPKQTGSPARFNQAPAELAIA
jgi:hypothetical protein